MCRKVVVDRMVATGAVCQNVVRLPLTALDQTAADVAATVVFYKPVPPVKEEQGDDKEKAGRSRLIARASWAFNAEQVDGWTAPTPPARSEVETREHVEAFIANTCADIRLRGAAAATGAMTLGTPSVQAENRQTLRFVAQADLKILDPVWTTAYITRNHSYLVYDTLFGTDENFRVQPQMVDRTIVSPDAMRYIFTLRDGLRWHDGQPVLSEDCVESLKRWGKKDRFGQLLMAHTAKIAPVDERTFTLDLAEPFGPVLEALGSQRPPFMMPARIASTPPEQQIKEIGNPLGLSADGACGNLVRGESFVTFFMLLSDGKEFPFLEPCKYACFEHAAKHGFSPMP